MDKKKNWVQYVFLILFFLTIYFFNQDEIETWGLFESIVVWCLGLIIYVGYLLVKATDEREKLKQKKIDEAYEVNEKQKIRKKFLSFRDG